MSTKISTNKCTRLSSENEKACVRTAVREMQRRQRGHVVRRSDVERLVGEVGGHEPPQSLDHGKSRVAVQVQRQPVVTRRCSCREACAILHQVF